jgi:hypothetical protein
VKTINRRAFNHNLAAFTNQVIETGEPIRVRSDVDGRSFIVIPDAESDWERWERLGLIEDQSVPPTRFADLPSLTGVSSDELIADLAGDW